MWARRPVTRSAAAAAAGRKHRRGPRPRNPLALVVKSLPASAGGRRLRLDPWARRAPEEGTATRSSILPLEMPGTEEPCRPQSMGSQTVGHDESD